ncbi:uncharacterized protein [Littorina saxatilis]|uniref:uncharacterized protein isoform X1 n=1 Tax=Littorina saxatilis TaxID=31220 RepID=UPI0038B6633C
MFARQNKLNSFRNTSTIIMSQTMKLVGSSCLFIVAVFCAVARSAEVTVTGKYCDTNHECGWHGYKYFWCYTSRYQDDWDYCCKPSHPCDTHNYSYQWCYHSYFGWSYCDTDKKESVDERDKTVGGRPCLSGESCGQHGYSYYWCYVQIGAWDYCCKPDHACAKHGSEYNWCRYGYWSRSWAYCKPEKKG